MSLDVLFELHIYFPLNRTVFTELSPPVCLGNTEFIAQHYFARFSVKPCTGIALPCTGIASHCIAIGHLPSCEAASAFTL